MVNEKKFLMNEMPWEQLEKLGITEEKFLDFPKDSIDRIMTGNTSPLMKMKFVDNEGNIMKVPESLNLFQNEEGIVPTKFRLLREADGKVRVELMPKRNELNLMLGETAITKEQLDRMRNQESVRTAIRKFGKDEMCYVQLDSELNVLQMTKEKEVVIPNAIGDVTIGAEIEQRLREGKPVELEGGVSKLTVGVDLNARNGFRVVEGDMDLWKQRKLEQWDRITPGVKGYWRTTENGWDYELHQDREQKQTIDRQSGQVLDNEQKMNISMTQGRGMRR